MSRETIKRRNLPHWYVPGAAHFVTFRLAGTLPRSVIEHLQHRKEQWLRQKPVPGTSKGAHRYRVHKQLFAEYDEHLDRHRDIAWLADARIAAMARRSLYHLHGERYFLLAYCLMPNHVHVLFLPHNTSPCADEHLSELEPGECDDGNSSLSAIMHSLKSYTAHEANRILRRKGPFWEHESYDHWVRDDDELERIVDYINANPVRVDLARSPHDWYWSSAHDRFLTDGDTSGWLRLDS